MCVGGGGGMDVCVGGGKGGFVHKQVDATVCNKKCYPSLKLSMSTFLSFTPYPHSPSLTFNQLSLSQSLSLPTLGRLAYSLYFDISILPIHFPNHSFTHNLPSDSPSPYIYTSSSHSPHLLFSQDFVPVFC